MAMVMSASASLERLIREIFWIDDPPLLGSQFAGCTSIPRQCLPARRYLRSTISLHFFKIERYQHAWSQEWNKAAK